MSKKFFNKIMVALHRNPWIKKRWAQNFNALESDNIPWTPLKKPLSKCKIALTSGGVHLRMDHLFDMKDKNGDPFNKKQQTAVFKECLEVLKSAQKPGIIVDSTHGWPRHKFN